MRVIRSTVLLGGVLVLVLAACGAPGAAGTDAGGTAVGAPDAQASSTPAVLGTIRATVDGTAQTWYVVSGTTGGRPYASGVWQARDEGRRVIILAGYETATPPLDTFEWTDDGMPRSYGSYTGSTMALTFDVGSEPAPLRITFPAERVSASSVIYANPAKLNALDTTYMIRSGTIDVSALSMADGRASATGTFSGTLALMIGSETVEIADGSFEVSGMPDLATLLPDPTTPR